MIRFFRAFLWLRWRLFVNYLRSSGDTTTKLVRWAQAMVTVVVPLLFVPVALGLGVIAMFAGKHLGTLEPDSPLNLVPVRILLGSATLVVIIAPLVRSIHGSASGRSRFLLLPISRSALHLSETASSLSDPWLFLMLTPLLMFPVGWFVWGSTATSLLMLAAGLALLLTLTTASALAAFLAHLFLRDRRRAELVTVAIITFITLASFAPALFRSRQENQNKESRKETQQPNHKRGRGLHNAASPLAWVVPSELYLKTLERAHNGRTAAGLLPLGALTLVGAALFLVSSRVHRRLLGSPSIGSPRRGRGKELEFRMYHLPGLGHAASAVAWTTARMALRTVKGKLAAFSAPVGAGALCLLLSRQWEGIDFGGIHIGPSVAGMFIALFLPLLALQPILLNTYAVDRAGLTLQFLSPVSHQDLVRGKIAGGALLTATATLPSLMVVALVTREGSPALWLAVILGAIATYLVLGPVFTMLSAIFPKAADLNSMGPKGDANKLASLMATFLAPAMLSPIAILLLAGQSLFGSLYAGTVLVAGWLVVAGLLSFPLTQLATAVLVKRSENVGLAAQGR